MPTTEPNEGNQVVALRLGELIGGDWSVTRYWDDPKESNVFIMESAERPEAGLTSYSTLGLSDHPLIVPETGEEYEARIEILGVAQTQFTALRNGIATVAFNIMNQHEFAFPGRVFQGAITINEPDADLGHILLVDPVTWDDEPEPLELPDYTVAFLQAVPITDEELDHIAQHGVESLLARMDQQEVDIYDPDRDSVA